MTKLWIAVLLAGLAACGNDTAGDDQAPPPSTSVYYGQIDQILNDNCVQCHSADPDRLAPFSLATYGDALAAANDQAVPYAVMTRQMPPYYADNDGSCGHYDTKWLTDDQIQSLTTWFNGDHAMGDPTKAAPPPGQLPDLDHVDVTLDPGAEYSPPVSAGTDLYRCFIVDPALTADRFLVGDYVHPKNNAIVHHVIVFALPDAAAEQQAATLDAQDQALGYDCFGGPGIDNASFLIGWAPGQGAINFPATTGVRVKGGRKLIMQVHYNLTNLAVDSSPDRTTVDLQFTDSVEHEAQIASVRGDVNLPPHDPDATAAGTRKLPAAPLKVWGSALHMHTRGTKAEVDAGSSCLIKLDQWSFHWQHFYWNTQPTMIPASSQLKVTCHYDTGDDSAPVVWGEKTTDEMCLAYLYMTQ
ncbi:MAG TPA: hypothetical protein VGC42_00960 [Kofleriaceae bacterium]